MARKTAYMCKATPEEMPTFLISCLDECLLLNGKNISNLPFETVIPAYALSVFKQKIDYNTAAACESLIGSSEINQEDVEGSF